MASFAGLMMRVRTLLSRHRSAPPLSADAVLRYLPTAGFYIECGAHDGVTASNTLKLEKMGWRGMLIEPSPSAFAKCKANRADSNIFVNCALVADLDLRRVSGDFDGAEMSSISGSRTGNKAAIEVPARTLQSLLDEYAITTVDFFSLDVEGYELEVLKGLDFDRCAPAAVLIEVYEKDSRTVENLMLANGYRPPVDISNFNKRTHPRWDGTHNDYLFLRNSVGSALK